METIQINLKKEVTEKKEIKLPYYAKSETHLYKVFSPTAALSIFTGSTRPNICIVQPALAFEEDEKECTEEEFLKGYNEVIERFNKIAE